MLVKFLIVATLVGTVCCGSVANYRGLGKRAVRSYADNQDPSLYYELPCMKYGGLCLPKDECPKGKEVGVNGLCPLQQKMGLECCHHVPKLTSCRSVGGECVSSTTDCGPMTYDEKPTECATDEKCCIWIL